MLIENIVMQVYGVLNTYNLTQNIGGNLGFADISCMSCGVVA